jgi:hypothetical protein
VGDLDTAAHDYTHTSKRLTGDEVSLEVYYVFYHWTRVLGSAMRNGLIALHWAMEDKAMIGSRLAMEGKMFVV